MWNGSDPSPDPVAEANAYFYQREMEEREWEETLPKCEICGEPTKDDRCIDLSEGYRECLVHKSCIHGGLIGEECTLSEDIREQIWSLIEFHCDIPAWR